jgi:phosphoglycerate dehydrogenase-like enzyme
LAQQRAKELGFDVRLNPYTQPLTVAQFRELLDGVDALITTWHVPRVDQAVLQNNSSLQIVGHAAGSVAGIVSPELYDRGIKVVTANVVMAQSVAQWSLMTTLMGWQRFLDYAGIGQRQEMQWDRRLIMRGLHDATVAIWGFGQIAQAYIQLLKPLGPREILVHSPYLTHAQARAEGLQQVSFDELFARGDIVILLDSLTEQNYGRVGADQLSALKDDAVLINPGRAHLVEEQALLAELKIGRFQAFLDVHYMEPLPAESPLRGLPNVYLTPHLAGRGREGMYSAHVLEEFDRFFRGEPLQSEVVSQRALSMTNELLMK